MAKNIRMKGNSCSERDTAIGLYFTIGAMDFSPAAFPARAQVRACRKSDGRPIAGVKKDTVIVPAYGRATVELVADQPGLTLFHCHIQQHMDFGFMALFRYA